MEMNENYVQNTTTYSWNIIVYAHKGIKSKHKKNFLIQVNFNGTITYRILYSMV